MNKDAVVAICFGYPAFIKNKIGLKNMPPPIPIIPEVKPIAEPIKNEIIFGIEFILIWSSLNDLLSINKKIPAMINITNNNISNNSLVRDIEALKNEKGIEPIK